MALTKVQPFNTNSTASFTFGNISSGNISGTNLVATGNATFSGANVSLGAVGNLHITGGTNAYVLSTDGVGNLSWVAQSGGGGGSGVVVLVAPQAASSTTGSPTSTLSNGFYIYRFTSAGTITF